MKYTAYVFCEPGMDRPCFSHVPPSPAQQERFARTGTHVYEVELDLPTFDVVDGTLKPALARIG